MDTDRNLLCAVLALQADLIKQSQFIQACTLWATRKHLPLGDLLVEQGWLAPVDRVLLEQLLERRLNQHQGDVQASLAAAAGPDVQLALASLHDAEVDHSLSRISAGPVSFLTDPYRPEVQASEERSGAMPSTAGRNLVFDEIGRGGMGAVFKGRDTELGRELAVKVLLEEHRDRPELIRRFLEEAQIAGQLQHPGVAPVYELGRFADDRPYFTMKLVKGHTLAELLRQRADVHEDLGRFLGIFGQVCQTVAFAHSHGVIHRDLKPSNVMVGRFGEVQVMDWGLAKVLRSDPTDELPRSEGDGGTMIRLARSGSTAADSETGTVGTPAYLAPEQARGEVAAVDERADVFGLGAVLFTILTSQPPFRGSPMAALEASQRGELGEAWDRLDGCGVDPELVAVCRECLAPAHEERPRDAGVVAARVAAYQAAVQERLRQAELERAAATAKAAEERKLRRVTVALAAAVLGLVLLGGGAAYYLQRQAEAEARRVAAEQQAEDQRAREHRQSVQAGVERLVELRRHGRWKEARVALEQTRSRLGESGPDDLRQRLGQEAAVLDLVDQLDAIRLHSLSHLSGKLDHATVDREFTSVDHEYAQAFQNANIATDMEEPAVVAERVRNSVIAAQLLAALDAWASKTRDKDRQVWLLAVARLVDPHAQRDRLRDPQAWKDPAVLKGRVDEVKVEDLTAPLAVALGIRLTGPGVDAERFTTTVQFLTAAQRQYPSDFWLAFTLGLVLQQGGHRDAAAGYYRIALALRPETAPLWLSLGNLLKDMGQLDEAIVHYQKAVALDPKGIRARYQLGYALKERGRFDEAVTQYQMIFELDPKDGAAHTALGNVLVSKHQDEEAIAEYRKAIDLAPEEATAHYNLGVLIHKDHPDEAITHFQKAVAINPNHADVQLCLGNALLTKGSLDEAAAHLQKAIELDPSHALAHYNLGIVLVQKHQLPEAIAHYQKAIDLDPKDAQVHFDLGNALMQSDRMDEAMSQYQQTIALDPRHARAYNNLGTILYGRHQLDEAMTYYRKAIECDPMHAGAYYNLGNCLADKGQIDKAIELYQQAIVKNSKYAPAHHKLGDALERQGRVDEAIAHYRKAVDLDPNLATAHNSLGVILLGKGQTGEAIQHFRKALALDPNDGKLVTNLGNALLADGQVEEAIATFKKAIELEPKFHLAHYNYGVALAQTGQLEEAINHYRKAIELSPEFAAAYGNLGFTLLRLGRFAEARDATRRSLDLLPRSDPMRPPTMRQLQQCEQFLVLDQKLTAVLKGEATSADAEEQLQLAGLAGQPYKQRFAAAARLYAAALEARPDLGRDLDKPFRYDGACCAALAAAGKGNDAADLDDKQRAGLRQQACDWLTADLALWARKAESEDSKVRARVQQTLQEWQNSPDLAGLREPEALAKLPEGERETYRKLWEKVEMVRKKATGRP